MLPDGSGFFVATVLGGPDMSDPVKWNPWNKVVQDHRDGTVYDERTNAERSLRGLPTPWSPDFANEEVHQPPVF